jgi:hypothetical protein
VHIELVELLRCLQPHGDTWLVAAIDRIDDREIVTATLGCPICRAEYEIRDRIVYFVPPRDAATATEADVNLAMRIAAALELTDAGGVAVLHGVWARHASFVRSLSPAQLIVVDRAISVAPGDGVNVVVCDVAPLARRSVRGIAVDASATPEMLSSLLAALRSGGRAIAPIALPLPDGLNELARDDEVWVAELRRDDVVPIRRARGRF